MPTKYLPWTAEEDALLREEYPEIGLKVAEKMPNRTYNSIRGRVQALGLVRGKKSEWSTEEIEILRQWYPVNPKEAAKRLPNHSLGSCSVKATHLGIAQSENAPVPAKRNAWTSSEDEVLKQYYALEGRLVANRLPGRSASACIIRASVLGITYEKNDKRFWTEEEIDILKKYWATEGENVSKRITGRNPLACKQKAKKLGLSHRTTDSQRMK